MLSDHSAPSDYSHSSEASARPSLEGSRSSLIFHDMDGPYRAHSRGHGQFDSISAPIQETVVAANEKRFGQVPTSSGGMEELTAAVGAALDELGNLSFDSTGSISQRDTSLTSVGSVLAPAQGEIAPSTPHQPRTPSMDTFDPTTPRQASTAEAEPAQIAAVTPTAPTSEAAATPRTIPARSSSTQYSPPKPAPMLARPVQVAPQGTPSATTPTLSQRAQAIARPARIHTYGRTIPWPNAFNPEPILQKRKAAPWERGRAYAQFANELMGTPTGLAAWIEIVQRPAGRRREFLDLPRVCFRY